MKKFKLSCNSIEIITKTVMAVIIYILMWIMVDNGTLSLIQHIIRAGFAQVILYAAWEYLAETKERLR